MDVYEKITQGLDISIDDETEIRRRYYETFKEEIKAIRRKYYQENKERSFAYSKKYYEEHKEEINAKRREKAKIKKNKGQTGSP